LVISARNVVGHWSIRRFGASSNATAKPWIVSLRCDMSETLGCTEDHTSTDRTWRAGLAVAADQGCEMYNWPGPYTTGVAQQP
jgi:hypothetical protein